MKVVFSVDSINTDSKSVITVGTFDGFHLGHRKLFEKVNTLAEMNGYKSIVVTFDPHPRTVLKIGDNDIKILSTTEEKLEIIGQCQINNVLVISFTKEFASTSYEKFVSDLLVKKLNLGILVIGHDHKFGKDRLGDENRLKELAEAYKFGIEVVEPVYIENELISSTKVRNALLNGDIKKANKFLARNYSFKGKVIHGATRGRLLGFPTANILVNDKNKLIPQNGVYAVKCIVDGNENYGIMNIGFRPTFETGHNLVIEVHIFDFNFDIYDREIEIHFIDRLRDEKKFESKEELIYQIEKDKKKAIQIIGNLIN